MKPLLIFLCASVQVFPVLQTGYIEELMQYTLVLQVHICIKNLYSKYSPHYIDVPEYILKTFSSILKIFPAESVDIPNPFELAEEFVVVVPLPALV